MTAPDLRVLRRSDLPVRALLEQAGRVFRDEFPNDSGNACFGVACEGGRFFVKHSDRLDRIAALCCVEQLYARVPHPSLPPLRNGFPTPDGYALVFDWVDGEHYRGETVRERFAALPVTEKLHAFETVLDLHVQLAAAGYVAEDLYDGCFLYDFDARRLYVCDLDEYHAGPFVLDRGRTFGSTRFMAPEEWVRGSVIDQRTTVYSLARTAAVLLGDRAGSPESFCGTPAMQAIIDRATHRDPKERFPSVDAFARAWRKTATPG